MEVVKEDTKVVVGKFYMVNCAKVYSSAFDNNYFVPIIGSYHTDAQFRVDYKHYHVDGRFASSKDIGGLIDGHTNSIFSADLPKHKQFSDKIIGYELKKLKCRTIRTGIRPPNRFHPDDKYHKWYKTFIGKSCAGKRCPHLGTLMHEHDGKLICPLHNLTANKKTEIIIEINQ